METDRSFTVRTYAGTPLRADVVNASGATVLRRIDYPRAVRTAQRLTDDLTAGDAYARRADALRPPAAPQNRAAVLAQRRREEAARARGTARERAAYTTYLLGAYGGVRVARCEVDAPIPFAPDTLAPCGRMLPCPEHDEF